MSGPAARRLRATPALAGALAAAELAYALLPARDAARVVAWASTNVDRLRAEPVGPLVVSAVVVEDHRVLWLALATAGALAVERRAGRWAVLAAAGVPHVVGTGVSEGILAWRVAHGRLPRSVLRISDVGPSYVVVGLLAAALVLGPVAVRVGSAATLAVLARPLLAGLGELDVAAVGHLTAAACGALVAAGLGVRSARFANRSRWAKRTRN